MVKYPKYRELGLKGENNVPSLNTWDIFPDASLGRLVLITPERTRRAVQLVESGERVNLDWTTDKPTGGCFARGSFNHTIHKFGIAEYGLVIDDSFEFNSQCGSQWDGLSHFAHQETGYFYGGKRVEDIVVESGKRSGGMSAWADHGIVGRAVLLDIYRWKTDRGEKYDPFTSFEITVEDLTDCAKDQNVEFEMGDILLIRSGYTYRHDNASPEQLAKAAEFKSFAGIEQSEEMLEFLHDSYFSAVAGDAPSFEVMPPQKGWFMHEYLLACWGIPIGEFWDLEALSETCHKKGRYEFLLSSKVINVPGGIASTPNAMAVF